MHFRKIAEATGYAGTEGTSTNPVEKNPLINLNTSATLKLFIKEIDKYVIETMIDPDVKNILTAGNSYDGYIHLYAKAQNKSVDEVLKNYKQYWKHPMDGKLLIC